MFWAAFRHGARTGLVPLDGDEDAPRGGVSSRVSLEVLRAYLPAIIRPGDIFMQDGAGIHRAHIIRNFFGMAGLIVMVWPPYSPDLNLIENL
jgi:transposase